MTMCKPACYGLLILSTVLLMAAGEPQEAGPGAAGSGVPSAPAAQPTNAVPPAPGPEVMRPTEHGLRLTPAMVRAFTGVILREKKDTLKLTPEQREQFRDVVSRRMLDVARKNEEPAQSALEYLIEVMASHEGRWTEISPEEAQEFGKRCVPLPGMLRELNEGCRKDLEPILDTEQRASLEKEMEDMRAGLDHFEQTLNRWAQGSYQKGDDPFNEPKPTAGDQKDATPAAPKKPEMRQAETVAENQMGQLGRNDWQMLLLRTERYFKFTPEQRAKAQQLLAEYKAKADSIMTPEWKQRMRTNRIQTHLQYMFKGQPTRPFFFHLQRDYEAMIKPVQQLGEEFKRDLLALITPEQRAAAQAELQQMAAGHGLQLEPADETLLGLGTTQPGGVQ